MFPVEFDYNSYVSIFSSIFWYSSFLHYSFFSLLSRRIGGKKLIRQLIYRIVQLLKILVALFKLFTGDVKGMIKTTIFRICLTQIGGQILFALLKVVTLTKSILSHFLYVICQLCNPFLVMLFFLFKFLLLLAIQIQCRFQAIQSAANFINSFFRFGQVLFYLGNISKLIWENKN